MTLTSSMEDYLRLSLCFRNEKGYARCTDVAEHLV